MLARCHALFAASRSPIPLLTFSSNHSVGGFHISLLAPPAESERDVDRLAGLRLGL
jgi:hypothetical protein